MNGLCKLNLLNLINNEIMDNLISIDAGHTAAAPSSHITNPPMLDWKNGT